MSGGVIISPRRINCPHGRAGNNKSVHIFFSKQSNSAENESFSPLPIFIHSKNTIPYTNTLPTTTRYLYTMPKTLGSCPKPKSSRQPIRIEHQNPYTSSANQNLVLCHPETPESSRLRWKTLLGCKLLSDRYRLSLYIGSSPPLVSSAHSSTTISLLSINLGKHCTHLTYLLTSGRMCPRLSNMA